MLAFNSYRRHLTARFGGPVLRIPINGGFSCPNRDGTKSSAGCTFCDNRSFSPAALRTDEVSAQVTKAIAGSKGRYKAFIPYLQPFSNTWGPVDRLREIYEPLLAIDGVVGLAIGTRPDCLDPLVIDYLADLNKRTFLLIELGLQSGHDATLTAINRGHSVADFIDAVKRLDAEKIAIAAHIILGLPGETIAMMVETARVLASLPVEAVKIHQLMVIRGTAFEEQYEQGMLMVLTIKEFADALAAVLSALRPDQLIHRIMANASVEDGLIAPMWSADKTESLNAINGLLAKGGVKQGSDFR